ncbi:MAG: 5-formyltetrahydrofolate cyclo-ligase [Polyangiaceae bacterium]
MIHDPDTLAEIQGHVRKLIRSRMRTLRKAHPPAALAVRSQNIVERVAASEPYRSARSVALFWPLSGEVDLRALDARARAEQKRVYYPVMDPIPGGHSTGFALTHAASELSLRNSRFMEPAATAPRAVRGEVDFGRGAGARGGSRRSALGLRRRVL